MKIIVVVLFNFFFTSSIRQVPKFPTTSYARLQGLKIKLPFVTYYGKDGRLIVFGSNHTNDYKDPQIKMIRDLICSSKPSVVLYEGDGIATEKTQEETVGTYFEMGLAKYIADSLKIHAANIEPKTEEKYKFLLSTFKIEDIMLATLGLQITMLQYNNENFETRFPIMINSLLDEGLKLNKKQQTLPYFYKLYKTKFGKPFHMIIFAQVNSSPKTIKRSTIVSIKGQMSSGTSILLRLRKVSSTIKKGYSS